MAYSSDFRHKVLSVRYKERLTIAQVAALFCVGVASVIRWVKNPIPQKTRNKPATKIDMDALARDVRDDPDAYQYERAHRFGVSVQGINYALRRLGVSYKKNTGTSTSERRRTAYLSDANMKSVLLSTSMKAVSHTICPVPMVMS
jgi:transposase